MTAKRKASSPSEQLSRFVKLAYEVDADQSSDALDRALGRLDMKKKEILQPAKRKTKQKQRKR